MHIFNLWTIFTQSLNVKEWKVLELQITQTRHNLSILDSKKVLKTLSSTHLKNEKIFMKCAQNRRCTSSICELELFVYKKTYVSPLLMSKAWVITYNFQAETLNTISNRNSSHFMQTISSYLVKIFVNVVNYCTIITWYKIVIDNCFCDGQSSKEYKWQSYYSYSASRLMLVDTCIKFREYSLSGFQVIERTWQSSKENNSNSMKGRVTILALCTSSHADWYLYKVSWI